MSYRDELAAALERKWVSLSDAHAAWNDYGIPIGDWRDMADYLIADGLPVNDREIMRKLGLV